ncbi:MAG: hypothetical protein IKI43_01070 [Campylobacter sp.]|nr:hypothetical protein [Campylobacter sp.]
MKKIVVLAIFAIFVVGCGVNRSSIPLNKNAFTQRNVFSISETLNLPYAKANLKNLDKARLEFATNSQNKNIIRSDVKVQKYVTTAATRSQGGENIVDVCTEAFVAIIQRYINESIKRNVDIVNISSNWRGNKESLSDEFVCMSSKGSVGIMMSADFAEK